MSKLIIEMEMPKDCPMCPMAHYNKLEEFTGCEVAPGKRYAVKTDKAYAESACRPDWCPIKGVLPDEHGDLIDKETAKNAFDSSFLTFRMKDGETMRGFYQRTIDELPVLIVAERKDDGKTAD